MSKVQLFFVSNYYHVLGFIVIVAFLAPLLIAAFSVQVAWFVLQTVLGVALVVKIFHARQERDRRRFKEVGNVSEQTDLFTKLESFIGRRWVLIWERQDGQISEGHRFFTRYAAERSAERLSLELGYPKEGKYPTSPVNVMVGHVKNGNFRKYDSYA